MRRVTMSAAALFVVATVFAGTVDAGGTVGAVQARGTLRCGVSEGIVGFSAQDPQGQWQGLDVDFCRAVAAAVLGDPRKVSFVPLKASMRFPALQAKRIDLLLRNTTWTMTREVLLDVQFPAVLFYDEIAILVRKSSGIRSSSDLDKATVCIEKGTTAGTDLKDYLEMRGLSMEPLVIDSASGAAAAFFEGRCRAYASDAAHLAAVRTQASGHEDEFAVLPERMSRQPLAPVIAGGDAQWATVVRWVLYVLILAEENGVTQANVREEFQKHLQVTDWRLAGGADERIARAIGVRPDWAIQIVSAVGNYGEIYERNLGSGSPLRLERGPNRLWRDGGLLYAPPID